MLNHRTKTLWLGLSARGVALGLTATGAMGGVHPESATRHETVEVDGLEILYREGGNPANPTILLLRGIPTSSHVFRNLIPRLADRFHLVAPDCPGFGYSSMPSRRVFAHTFARTTDVVEEFVEEGGLDSYSLYLMGYGAPVGFRPATRHPGRVTAGITPGTCCSVRAARRSSWISSGTTGPTLRFIRSGRSICAVISRRR